MTACLAAISEPLGIPFDPDHPDEFLAALGPMAYIPAPRWRTPSIRPCCRPVTANVVPSEAEAVVDGGSCQAEGEFWRSSTIFWAARSPATS